MPLQVDLAPALILYEIWKQAFEQLEVYYGINCLNQDPGFMPGSLDRIKAMDLAGLVSTLTLFAWT